MIQKLLVVKLVTHTTCNQSVARSPRSVFWLFRFHIEEVLSAVYVVLCCVPCYTRRDRRTLLREKQCWILICQVKRRTFLSLGWSNPEHYASPRTPPVFWKGARWFASTTDWIMAAYYVILHVYKVIISLHLFQCNKANRKNHGTFGIISVKVWYDLNESQTTVTRGLAESETW